MSHKRKKAGGRKDKKTARMRDAEEFKRGMAKEPKPQTDQWDIQTHKPGHKSDRMNPQDRARNERKE